MWESVKLMLDTTLPLFGLLYLTLDTSFHLFYPQFPYLSNGDVIPTLRFVFRTRIEHAKLLGGLQWKEVTTDH